jgi:hypothetical protein
MSQELKAIDYEIAAETLKTEFPTNDQVLTSIRVFKHLGDVGAILGQNMLTVWANTYYSQYQSIAYARRII